ncbi:MAG: universal stress protein [Gaiellaceae bacterium]|jgi:nucleotide-binding universal stress UspA family protein
MIVVGVDGSECSRSALHFALHEAVIRQTKLRIVVVWHVPLPAYGAGWAPPPPHLAEDAETAAREVLEEALEEARAGAAPPQIEPILREGQPANVLVEESARAEMLVIGSRGWGGFRELLLGSVSQQSAHHSHCPVVIVRAGCEGESSSEPSP